MRPFLQAIALLTISLSVRADVLPPHIAELGIRMREHPNLIDRIERQCADKRPGDACVAPGTPFSGGGSGSCKRTLNQSERTIDLVCQVEQQTFIDRKLPDNEVGFVHDADLCSRPDRVPAGLQLQCSPLASIPVDAFCTGKPENSPCTADVHVEGLGVQRYPGTCTRVTQRKGFYFQGRRQMTRDVILCQAPPLPEPQFDTVSWFKKLFQ